jgi:hypothetical protein
MARGKKKVVRKVRAVPSTRGGRRPGAGRRPVESHFAALNTKLDAIMSKLGLATETKVEEAAPVVEAPKPAKVKKVKLPDVEQPAPTFTAPVAEVAPVAHVESPVAQPLPVVSQFVPPVASAPVAFVPPPAPAPLPVTAPDFNAQFAALNNGTNNS